MVQRSAEMGSVGVIKLAGRQSREVLPGLFQAMGKEAPAWLEMMGEIELLHSCKLALFSSVRCPGSILSKSFDLANGLRQNLVTVMSGFHAPVEKEWFTLLHRSATPMIHCPARSLVDRRLTPDEQSLLAQNRYLLLNFGITEVRISRETAFRRNLCMAAAADLVFIAYAVPGGRTEELCAQVRQWGKPVWTFADAATAHLQALGVRSIRTGAFISGLAGFSAS
ncbi:MAG TPA: hypothetical protein PKI62_08590 [bacterium]|nr:hypothetical protein [bacterium]HPR87493.1 hypothetical protein [bacterium]